MIEFLGVMTLPFLACLVLTGIHAYLGLHVLEREVIFVDLALGQIAVLGAAMCLLAGLPSDGPEAYWSSLAFAVFGAAIFAATRRRKPSIPQEALIGIVYAVSAAALLLLMSRSGEGNEHLREALTGNLLLVSKTDVLKMFAIYLAVGAIHLAFRRQFFLISRSPAEAYEKGLRVRGWDFLFYVTFGIVVTSSVRVAGVLLVFSYLVVPAACSMLFASRTGSRLAIAWSVGFLVSVIGISVSYFADLPTGETVVCSFGAVLVAAALVRRLLPKR